jgi:uncharacterized coiled-coil DUF342 family protein
LAAIRHNHVAAETCFSVHLVNLVTVPRFRGLQLAYKGFQRCLQQGFAVVLRQIRRSDVEPMKDPETSSTTDPDTENTHPGVAVVSSELELTGSNLHQLDISPDASKASHSLGRLEHDLKQLQSKWQVVERELSDRDEQISHLQNELLEYRNQLTDLDSNLAEVTIDRNSIYDDLSVATADAADWRAQCDGFERELESRSSELDALRVEQKALLEEKQDLEITLAREQRKLTAKRTKIEELEARNVELRVHVQELQDYINGRKNDWDELNSRVREYEKTIEDLTQEELPQKVAEHIEISDEIDVDPTELLPSYEQVPDRVILIKESETDTVVRYPLEGVEFTIGRSRNSHIRLDHKFISRLHATIRIVGSDVVIEDAGSTNGILVNSIQTTRHKLKHGDNLQLGSYTLQYLEDDSESISESLAGLVT